LGAVISERRFAGAREPDGKNWVPNITPHPTGTGGWTLEDFEILLKTGDTPNFVDVGGLMRAVVRNTAALPESDRTAMGEYLLTLPPREGRPPPATNSE
jgi:hypothetical protein